VAADGEAEPGAAIGAAARAFDAVEALEEMRQRRGRHARRRILEVDRHPRAVAPSGDAQAPAAVGVARRVLEQVAEQLGQPIGVAKYWRFFIKSDFKCELPFCDSLAVGAHGL